MIYHDVIDKLPKKVPFTAVRNVSDVPKMFSYTNVGHNRCKLYKINLLNTFLMLSLKCETSSWPVT